jgi:hypothetical protein
MPKCIEFGISLPAARDFFTSRSLEREKLA